MMKKKKQKNKNKTKTNNKPSERTKKIKKEFYSSHFFPLLIISMPHFSERNSIPISWLYILIVCIRFSIAQSAAAVEYTDCNLCRGVRLERVSWIKNLLVRFQSGWSFGECGAPLHCHRFQVHSSPEW